MRIELSPDATLVYADYLEKAGIHGGQGRRGCPLDPAFMG
jgi:hypothetical protein